MANDLATKKPAVGFWEYQWIVFSRIAAGLLLVGSFSQPTLALTLIGLSVLMAGHTIAKAIKDAR
jgi:hypothetical protein